MGTKIRVMVFEADDVDAGTMGRLMELIDGRNRMPTTPAAVASLPVVTPAPALQAAPMAERPVRTAVVKPRKRGRGAVRLLVSKDFPGRTFTADQVKEICGIGEGTYLGPYIAKGMRVGGKHVFTYADETAPDADATTTTADGEGDAGDEDEEGGDDDDDPPEAKPDAVLWLDLKVCPSLRRRQRIRNVLIERNMKLIHYHAERMSKRLPPEVEIADLIQAGVFGLMDAIKSFDALRGVKFPTFAGRRVNGAMNDYLREIDWVPRLVRNRSREVGKATAAARNALGHEPNRDEIAEELGLSASEVEKLIGDGYAASVKSLSETMHNDGDEARQLGQIIPDTNAPDPLDEAARRDWWERIVRGLSRTEKTVVLLYHRDGMTMKEVSGVIGLTESRVSQMHSNLLAILRARGRDGNLHP